MSIDNGGDPAAENSVPDATEVSVTPFVHDQMFQRWLLDRIHQRKEFEFERGSLPPVIGFLTGMDDHYYSVSTSDQIPRSQVLPRPSVTRVSETGRSLHELDQGIQVLIKRYTKRIHRAAAETLMPASRIPRPVTDRPRQNSI